MAATKKSERLKDKELRNLKAETDRMRARLSLLSELGRRITSTLDLPTVLQEVIDAACELTGARYGALVVFDGSGQIDEFATHGISQKERERIGNLPQGLGLLGWLQQHQQPLRIADLSQHPRSVGFPPNHPPMKSFLGTPIRYQDEALGNLYLTEKVGATEFTPEDEQVLILFAAQAAMAIRNARLHQSVVLQHERLDTILTQSPDGIIFVESFTGNLQANRRAEEMVGCSLGSQDGLAILEERCRAADGSPLPLEAHPLYRALEGEFVPGEEHLLCRADGSDYPILCSGAPIRHSDGSILGAIIQFQDMTSVKESQRALKESKEVAEQERSRLEVLVNTSPVGVFVAQAGTNQVLLVNREARRILGFSEKHEEQLEWYEKEIVYRRADGSAYQPEELPLQRALSQGETVRAEEIRFEFSDGHTIPTLVNATPVYSADGEITAGIAVIQDITPLEQIENLRSEFLGMVSHELKTPLAAIKGSAATVLGSRRPLEPEETRELFQIIDEQSDRLRDLVDNLLDMTRIEAGSLSVRTEPADIRQIIGEARETFTRTGRAH
ncbi:MAG: PAS domain S-box protein, partial [Dehalococcoidia bacterium]